MKEDFMNAATQGDVEKVRQMLKADPTLASAKDEKGISVILKATYYGKRELAAVLVASKGELDIFEAAATGQTDQLRALIKQEPAAANACSPDGFFPLGLAVFFGHPETVEALLANGAEVNTPSRESMKVSPLHSAAAARQLEIARMLIDSGADPNARAESDLTPLHEAAANGEIEFARLLLERGANVNARTSEGKTPLAFAQQHQRTQMVELLRREGAVE